MYEAFGNYNNNHADLIGIKPFYGKENIIKNYPSDSDIVGSLELGASIHREVRRFLQPYLRPGLSFIELATLIEMKTTELSNREKTINKGIGFPVGISVNECAAHFHPSKTNKTVFKKEDVIKIDFGTEVNGWIIDSAFTITFDHKYDNLLEAVQEATETGLKVIGVDGVIGDYSEAIQETMESFEINLNGKDIPIKAIENLGGHNIGKGIIHNGIFLPCVGMKKSLPLNYRFKEGVYAVETFGSTGNNTVNEVGDVTLYRINPSMNPSNVKLDTTKKVYNKIIQTFKTLPFCDRYVETFNINNCNGHLKVLTSNNLLHSYPPLCVNKGAYTAQYEHTVYISENNKKILSRGDDY